MKTISYLTDLLKEEAGQDLVEYSLLLGTLAFGSIALLSSVGTTVKGVWVALNSGINTARAAVS